MSEKPQNSNPDRITTRSMIDNLIKTMGGERISFGPETVSDETSAARSINTRARLKERLRRSRN